MKSLLITFPTAREAKATIEKLKAVVMSDKNIYSFDLGYILITGMGCVSAGAQTAAYLPLANEVWNLGVAGSLHEVSVGSVFDIQTVSKFVHMPDHIDEHSRQFSNNIHPSLSIAPAGKRLVTTDFPIHDDQLRQQLSSQYDLVDMESYAIVYAANQAAKPCRSWKWVSDFCKLGGEKLIREHLDRLSEDMSEFIYNKIR